MEEESNPTNSFILKIISSSEKRLEIIESEIGNFVTIHAWCIALVANYVIYSQLMTYLLSLNVHEIQQMTMMLIAIK